MQRYFKDTLENTYNLSREDSYHIIKVMRMSINDEIEVVINGILHIARIININDGIVTVKNIRKEASDNELPYQICLVQSLVKEQKMDYILQKSCELGVNDIIILNTSRSVVKLNSKEQKKIDRWNRIVKEASEQSKRNKIPNIVGPLDIKQLIKLDYDLKLLCIVNENTKSIKKVLQNLHISDRILFVIGPEGGFTNQEEELMINSGFIPISLGNKVLRTETASLFILSCINYEIME